MSDDQASAVMTNTMITTMNEANVLFIIAISLKCFVVLQRIYIIGDFFGYTKLCEAIDVVLVSPQFL